jgi:zinc/manganese transport system ATP-binding protein
MSRPAIELHGLALAWPGAGDQLAVEGLSGVFEWGSLTAIVGPNGGGKSSLVAALSGQLAPRSGAVHLAPELQGRMAVLPQVSQVDRSFPIRVLDVVMMGHWGRQGAWRAATKARRLQAEDALAAVGLPDASRRSLHELSHGQFQRVLFARLLLQDAPLMVLDEPFAAVDAATTADLLALLGRWHAQARTVICVLHDLDCVREHFPQTLLLARQPLGWGPTSQVLTPALLQRAQGLGAGWRQGSAGSPALGAAA